MPLITMYNESNTEKTVLNIVNITKDFGCFPILKSTDTDLPNGLSFHNEDGSLKHGVKEQENLFGGGKVQFASVQKITTTLEQAKENKITQLKSKAENDIKSISDLDDDIAEQKQAIKDALAVALEGIDGMTTIQEVESIA